MRNLFGIVLPGAILLLVLSYVFFTTTSALGWSPFDISWMTNGQSLTLIVLFLLSYLLGSLMRLNSAEKLDKKSGRLLQKKYMRRKGLSREDCEERTKEAWKMLQPDPSRMDTPWDLLEGSWGFDTFPYPIWQFWRLKLYRPREAYLFFWPYRDFMRQNQIEGAPHAIWQFWRYWDRSRRDPIGGRSFFNYCRTVLYHARRETGDLLVAEVQSVEAEVRFFAGTYYALLTGVWIVCISLVTQLALHPSTLVQFKPLDHRTLTLYVTVLLVITMYMMKRAILKRFRTLRIKKADTLLDAFYLVHRHDPQCPKCSGGSPKVTDDSSAA
jgi:hypothetical protein